MRNLVEGLVAPQSNHVIENNLLILRQEGFGDDLIARFTSTFEGIFNSVSTSLENLTKIAESSEPKGVVPNVNMRNDFKKAMTSLNYVAQADTPVPCPDGFKGDWLGYVKMLDKTRYHLVPNAHGAIEDFKAYLALIIGDRNAKITVSDKTAKYKQLAKSREADNKQFHSWFNDGNNQRQSLSKMFENFADAQQSFDISHTNWETVKKIKLSQLRDDARVLAERMNLIIEWTRSKSEVELSKQALLNLADGAYEVACQLEHIALFIARNEIAFSTSRNICDRLISLAN